MYGNGWQVRTIGVTVIGLATGLGGCRPPDGGEALADEGAVANGPVGARVVSVEVTPVAPESFVDYVRITGEVEAYYDVTVSAEESGTIARFAVEKGTRVSQGQVIAKIDDAVLRAQVDEARAIADVAREQYERQRRLLEEESIGSEIAVLQLRSTSGAADARLEMMEERLRRTEIKAPVAGIFDEKYVETGELVSPGTRIARVVAVRRVKIIGGVPERYALDIQRGDSARITFDVLPDEEFLGTISFVGASVNPSNRTIPIEIVLDNRERLVKPQMVANVQIERARSSDVIVVAQDLVIRTEDGYQVFVVADRDGQLYATAKPVELGAAYANRVVIEQGLVVGDRLITTGHRLVDEGSYLRVVGSEGANQ